MKYRHAKDNRVMEVLKFDDRAKTYLIKFEDGTSTTIASSTFKRWWKPIEEKTVEQHLVPMPGAEKLAELKKEYSHDEDADDAYVAEVMKQKKQLGIECPEIKSVEIVNAGDGTPLAEVGKEIAEQAKEKASRAKKVIKKETVAIDQDDVAATIIKEASLYVTPKSKHDLVLKNDDKKMLAIVYVGKKSLTFYFNGEDIKEKLIAGGAEIVESSEKFDYYSKIDINTLISVLPMLTA